MVRVFIFVFFLAMSLCARENPFKPVISLEKIGAATNVKPNRENLKEIDIKVPDSARVLKKVTIEYQNLDGSISSKSVEVDKNIDWHYPVVLSQKRGVKQVGKKASRQKIKPLILHPLKFLTLEVSKNSILFVTNDKKIRDFILLKPYKIVIDFKRDASFYTKSVDIKKAPFEKITLGNHNGYYRAVLLLDGSYKYKLTKTLKGYLCEVY